MKKQSLATKVSDVLIIFAMVFSILLLLFVLKGAINYWTVAFKSVLTVDAQMFWIGLFVAIVYAIFNFIAGFVKEIARIIRRYI